MIKAVGVSIDIDLQALSVYLRQQGIAHRINEESGTQVVWVRDESDAQSVRELVERFLSGAVEFKTVDGGAAAPLSGRASSHSLGLLSSIWMAPVTTALILVCALVALVTQLGRLPYRVDFLFYPLLPVDGLFSLLFAIDNPLVLLQTLGPMLLHFGAMHIVFNMLWLYYFGRQLEVVQSSGAFLLVVLVTSFAGNTAQYLYSGANNFGGMSGVVYGLVGYAWILHSFVPGKRLMLNNSIFMVFLIMLVGMEVVAGSWIATAAHAGGLIAGLLAGLLVLARARLQPAPHNKE